MFITFLFPLKDVPISYHYRSQWRMNNGHLGSFSDISSFPIWLSISKNMICMIFHTMFYPICQYRAIVMTVITFVNAVLLHNPWNRLKSLNEQWVISRKLRVSSSQLKINLRGGKWPAPWCLVANFIKPIERIIVVFTLILFVCTYVLNILWSRYGGCFWSEKGYRFAT